MDRHIVLASLILIIAIYTALTPPGGVWQNIYVEKMNGDLMWNPYLGKSVLAYREPQLFLIFVATNMLSFLSSLTVLLLIATRLHLKMKRMLLMWLQSLSVVSAVAMLFIVQDVIFRQPNGEFSMPNGGVGLAYNGSWHYAMRKQGL